MVNENENTQPELNMVSEEPTAPVAEPQTEPATEAPTEAPAEPTSETTATETSAPKVEENIGTYPSSVEPENNVQQTLQQTQQRLAQVEQQNQQTQANVMGQMRGAAGGSGVAGLAQAMSNQGAIQAQQASASIGQQESANQKAAAQQAGQLQKMTRQGAWKADMTRSAGAQEERQAIKEKTNTLFGMSINRLDTAKGAVAAGDEAFTSGVGEAFSPTGGLF